MKNFLLVVVVFIIATSLCAHADTTSEVMINPDNFDYFGENRKKEAGRFAAEAKFLMSQKRYEAALEKAEAVAALEPENLESQKLLINALVCSSMHLIEPGGDFSYKPSSIHPKVRLEDAQNACKYAVRALDIAESMRAAGLGALSETTVDMMRQYLDNITRVQHPSLRNESITVNRRILQFWLEHGFRARMKRVDSRKSCEENLGELWNANGLFFHTQTPADLAAPFEETMEAMLRLTKQWNVDVNRLPIAKRYCDIFTDTLANYMKRHSTLHGTEPGEAFERTITMLENDPRPFFRFYGWSSRHKPEYHFAPDKSVDPRPSREYFLQLKAMIEKLPAEMDPVTAGMYYNELNRVVLACGAGGEFSPVHSFLPMPYYQEILETACRRKELAIEAALSMMDHYTTITWVFRSHGDMRHIRDEAAMLRKIDRRLRELVAEQLILAEQQDTSAAGRLHDGMIKNEFFFEPLPRIAPWKEAVKIPENEVGDGNYHALLRSNVLMLLRHHGQDLVRYDYDLETKKGTKGKSLTLGYYYTSRSPSSHKYDTMFADETNLYFGTQGNGIFIFPHDGSEPWTLTTEDELPSDFVHGIGSLNGKLYAGLGEENKPSWLVSIDLATKTVDILSSSSAKDGRLPFYNMAAAPRFSFFLEDAKRNRLLFFVHVAKRKSTAGGLWAVDGTTGIFSQLKRFVFDADSVHWLGDADRIYIRDSWTACLVDPDDGKRDRPPKMICRSKGYREGEPSFSDCNLYAGTVMGGYVWGIFGNSEMGWTWSRIPWNEETNTSGRKERELLKSPNEMDDSWSPCDFLPLPDGRGMIVGNSVDLFLLRFE